MLVSDFYPPLIGGATRAAQILAHELRRRDYVVDVATTWQPGTAVEEVDDAGVAIHRLRGLTMRLPVLSANLYRRIAPPFPDPELVWRLRRLLRRVRPEIVHSSGWLPYSCAVALLGSDVPFVLAGRDCGSVCANGTMLHHDRVPCAGPAPSECLSCAVGYYGASKGLLAVLGVLSGRYLLRRRVQAVHSVSHYARDVLREHLVQRRAAPAGRHGILETIIPDFRTENDIRLDDAILDRLPREPFILFVGALREVKGVRVLLEAYERLNDPPPLVLMGTRSHDMPAEFPRGVTVEYDVDHATVMAAWDMSLFGVALSVWPGPLGNPVHEAMSRGKPVIGTTPRGHSEMIEPETNGILVRAGSVSELAIAMQRLIVDGELRERFARAAKSSSARFTAEVQMPRIDSLFSELLLGAKGPQ